jgi:hypothetical protein
MQIDVLRCKTPELVRKEVWTHPISFKGAIQTLEAFQPLIAIQGDRDSAFRVRLYQQLLDALTTHCVADRPERFEPRLRKRRPKHYGFHPRDTMYFGGTLGY